MLVTALVVLQAGPSLAQTVVIPNVNGNQAGSSDQAFRCGQDVPWVPAVASAQVVLESPGVPYLSWQDYSRPLIAQGYARDLCTQQATLYGPTESSVLLVPPAGIVDARKPGPLHFWVEVLPLSGSPRVTNAMPLSSGTYVEPVFPALWVHVVIRPDEFRKQYGVQTVSVLIETNAQVAPLRLYSIEVDFVGDRLRQRWTDASSEAWFKGAADACRRFHEDPQGWSERMRQRMEQGAASTGEPDSFDLCSTDPNSPMYSPFCKPACVPCPVQGYPDRRCCALDLVIYGSTKCMQAENWNCETFGSCFSCPNPCEHCSGLPSWSLCYSFCNPACDPPVEPDP